MTKKHEHTTETPETNPQPKASSRRVYLFGRLENEIAMPVIARLLKLNDRDSKRPIDLYINSAGGNGYNADAIIAVMHSISAPVNTICLGHALSGACEILASATGKRQAYEFSTLMFHQTLWEADGDITNLEIQAHQGQRFREAQIELLHRCTGKTKDTIRTDIERDHYMSAGEALRYGLIDEIIPHTSKNHKSRGKKAKSEGKVRNIAKATKRASKVAASYKPKKSARSTRKPGRK